MSYQVTPYSWQKTCLEEAVCFSLLIYCRKKLINIRVASLIHAFYNIHVQARALNLKSDQLQFQLAVQIQTNFTA